MLASRFCARVATRPTAVLPLSSHLVGLQASGWRSKRVFVSTPRHRKDDARIRTAQAETQAKQPATESPRPEPATAQKPDPLLSEQTKTNKEQRKADWRIIQDMSHYIWPKDDLGTRFRVGLSVALLVGAKVRRHRLVSFSGPLLIAVHRSSTSKSPSTSRPSSTA